MQQMPPKNSVFLITMPEMLSAKVSEAEKIKK